MIGAPTDAQSLAFATRRDNAPGGPARPDTPLTYNRHNAKIAEAGF